jgi:hypothetical protein
VGADHPLPGLIPLQVNLPGWDSNEAKIIYTSNPCSTSSAVSVRFVPFIAWTLYYIGSRVPIDLIVRKRKRAHADMARARVGRAFPACMMPIYTVSMERRCGSTATRPFTREYELAWMEIKMKPE